MSSPIPESSLLKPRDPSLTNENEWEEFQLTNAEVRDQSGNLISLLSADAGAPVTLTGRLEELGKDEIKLLRDRTKYSRSMMVKVEEVVRFAYGQYPDGSFAIWAEGRAGWFRPVTPSRRYREIFARMTEDIQMLYFVTDFYKPKKSQKAGNGSVETLFNEYSQENPTKCQSVEHAKDEIYSHREFLISSMLHGKEGLRWESSPIYEHFKKTFPEEFEALKRRMVDPKEKKKGGRPRSKAGSDTGPHISVKSGRSTTSRGRTKSKPIPVSEEMKEEEDNDDDESLLISWMESPEIVQTMDAEGYTIANLATLLYQDFKLESEGLAADYLRFYGSAIQDYIKSQKSQRRSPYTGQRIYYEFAGAKIAKAKEKKVSAIDLKKRPTSLRPTATPAEKSEETSEESSDDDINVRKRASKGKYSALRPKSSKGRYSGKGAKGRKGKSYPSAESSDSEEVDSDLIELTSSTKRKGDSDLDALSSPRKRTVSRGEDNEDVIYTRSGRLPLRWKAAEPATPGDEDESSDADLDDDALSQPTIITTPLSQTMEANVRGDTFLCRQDGCSHKVYGTTSDEGKTLIQEHLREHERANEAIELVKLEESRNRLPVSHLIKRIREMAAMQAAQGGAPPSPGLGAAMDMLGGGFPQPIVRKY